jgi:hypothetical protein
MTVARRLTAPLSILTVILISTVAYQAYYGMGERPPILLNTKFKLFTKDPYTDGLKPYLWDVVYYKGPNDTAFTRPDVVGDVACLGLHVYQDGVNDTYDWATIHVKQELRGSAVERMLQGKLHVWVYPTFSYKYYEETGDPRNVFGLEINDGRHILWYVFSDVNQGVYQVKNHRIVVVETPLNQWSHKEIDVGAEYREAGWEPPKDLSLILILGATKHDPGWRAGYFKEISVTEGEVQVSEP